MPINTTGAFIMRVRGHRYLSSILFSTNVSMTSVRASVRPMPGWEGSLYSHRLTGWPDLVNRASTRVRHPRTQMSRLSPPPTHTLVSLSPTCCRRRASPTNACRTDLLTRSKNSSWRALLTVPCPHESKTTCELVQLLLLVSNCSSFSRMIVTTQITSIFPLNRPSSLIAS